MPNYQAYLKSEHWKRRRARAIEEAGGACGRCGSESHLHVHHRSYENLGGEKSDDLEVLCAGCHLDEHPEHKMEAVWLAEEDCDFCSNRISILREVNGEIAVQCLGCSYEYRREPRAPVQFGQPLKKTRSAA